MATTNHVLAALLQARQPHTFNALQHLVMTMADFQKNRHKPPLFGWDRALASYKKFHAKLRDTLIAMEMDGLVTSAAPPSEYREQLIDAIDRFSEVFPNWLDAYDFAMEYLTRDDADGEIQRMLKAP